MATASIARPTRTDKAIGITLRQECTPLDDYPGYYSVRDTLTGSGRFHIATLLECDCPDFTHRRRPCKHVEAVRATETALHAYAAAWDAQARPCCTVCGAGLTTAVNWVGGKGYCSFEVCSADGSHPARMV